MNLKPIKRHPALQNLSREHHDILVFGLRVKKGIAKQAKVSDLQDYSDWFWANYLKEHFELEEESLFPLFNIKSDLLQTALAQHQDLKLQFNKPEKSISDFKKLYESLKQHIRFEERELFNKIQNQVDESSLNNFSNLHKKQQACGVWLNAFWK